jgi:hypothetical protein
VFSLFKTLPGTAQIFYQSIRNRVLTDLPWSGWLFDPALDMWVQMWSSPRKLVGSRDGKCGGIPFTDISAILDHIHEDFVIRS